MMKQECSTLLQERGAEKYKQKQRLPHPSNFFFLYHLATTTITQIPTGTCNLLGGCGFAAAVDDVVAAAAAVVGGVPEVSVWILLNSQNHREPPLSPPPPTRNQNCFAPRS